MTQKVVNPNGFPAKPKRSIQLDALSQCVDFVTAKGLLATECSGVRGFVDKVRIVYGVLTFDPSCRPCDFLHEAGHLAVLPAKWRSRANDDLSVVFKEMCEYAEKTAMDPDGEEMRGMIQSGEYEATAWSFAAGVAIGLPPELIISDDSFFDEHGIQQGESVRAALAIGCFAGISGLHHGGFCQSPHGMRRKDDFVFPKMRRWTQR